MRLTEKNLHGYQKKAVRHIINNPFAALFMEMGLGKTVCALTAVDYLLNKDLEISKCLIIGTKRVVENVWAEEAAQWEHLKSEKIIKVTGDEKSRIRAFEQKANIFLISKDNVAWMCARYGGFPFKIDMLVIDESSSFKNADTVRFKALRRAVNDVSRTVILTGTPAPQSLIDLWSQIYLLDKGERLGHFISHYRNCYFRKGFFKYELRKGSEEKIKEKIKDICISMQAKDFIDMPKKIVNDIHIKLSNTEINQYLTFKKEKILEIMEQEFTTVNAAALHIKLMQFANGFMYTEEKAPVDIHKHKIDALREIVDNLQGRQAIVAWNFKHDESRITKGLKHLNVRSLKKAKDIEDWNEGRIQILTFHPASGGHGLNLQKGGNILIWYSLPQSLELYDQTNARIYRQGQIEKQVYIHRLISKDTVDEKIAEALKNKSDVQRLLMLQLKEDIKNFSNKLNLFYL